MKKAIIYISLIAMIVQSTACGKTGSVAKGIELMSATTKQEVLDYYANALKYGAVITRGSDDNKNETSYEEYEVTGSKKERVIEMQSKVEKQLSYMRYDDVSDKSVINEDCFNYMKAYMNDVSLSKGTIDSVTGALGYYFIDVTYETKPRSSGQFTGKASLVGVNGAFTENVLNGEIELDNNFISAAVDIANKYFILNNIEKNVTYSESESFRINKGKADVNSYYSENIAEQLGVNDGLNLDLVDESIVNTEVITDEDNTEVEETTEQVVENLSSQINKSGSRKVTFDIKYFNNIVGASASGKAMMPSLEVVYRIPSNEGDISGVGIYPCGNDGMRLFGYDRTKSNGEMTLRYIFKDKEDGSGKIESVMIYPRKYTNNITEIQADSNVLIPEYLIQELNNTLERADRVIVNCDLNGMISDNIFNDMGFGILRGYYSKSTNVLKWISQIRQIVARDIENNTYLLEVDTVVTEGPKSADSYGTYRDRAYVVIQQDGTKFNIIDWVRLSRSLIEEPDIDVNNSTIKRLVALNLTGEVNEETKEKAKSLLNELYKASTYRVLNGPKELNAENGTVVIEKGMYDCFNDDKRLLSTDKKETMNARLRDYLTAYGTNVSAKYIGRVDEWIGGAENQVEFTTEELVIYGNGNAAMYLRTYYLMSSINDVWKIDQMTFMDTEELVEIGKIEEIKERIEQSE